MKLSVALLSAAVTLSAAQPHRHQHLHLEKRVPNPVAGWATAPGPTKIVYMLNGQTISEDDVQQGIQNGTYILANHGHISPAGEASNAPNPAQYLPNPVGHHVPTVMPTQSTPPPTGLDTDFPDGELDCSTFPSDYGAVSIKWTGLGGWTGIQCPQASSGQGYSDILTKSKGGTCEEGDYCSYACPPGYQKTQWPTTQGSTGQSIGGLLCKNGKLYLSNPSFSSKLCMTGHPDVAVLVKNNLSKNVAICRTDYPGTESETVPTNAMPGATMNLTCPDADNYYKWEGSSTSAQYYVNPAGVSPSDACQWGSPSNPWGNYAPLNIGVGYSNGAAWLSIFQNSPTTDAKLEYTVTIEGDSISGTCKYSNGQYCSGPNYDQCSSTSGCTVSMTSGTATYVLSD